LPDLTAGDGAGVGKGRQLAACAYEHLRTGGTRVLWISVSADLRVDAARDLDDLGLERLPLYPKRGSSGGLPRGDLDDAGVGDGVLFFTYSLLIAGSSKGQSRLDQALAWLEKDAKGALIIFDESHRCKNLYREEKVQKATITARTGVELQEALPDARVIYASATGASTPYNLGYQLRLGAFGMPDFRTLLSSLNGAGAFISRRWRLSDSR